MNIASPPSILNGSIAFFAASGESSGSPTSIRQRLRLAMGSAIIGPALAGKSIAVSTAALPPSLDPQLSFSHAGGWSRLPTSRDVELKWRRVGGCRRADGRMSGRQTVARSRSRAEESQSAARLSWDPQRTAASSRRSFGRGDRRPSSWRRRLLAHASIRQDLVHRSERNCSCPRQRLTLLSMASAPPGQGSTETDSSSGFSPAGMTSVAARMAEAGCSCQPVGSCQSGCGLPGASRTLVKNSWI